MMDYTIEDLISLMRDKIDRLEVDTHLDFYLNKLEEKIAEKNSQPPATESK